MRLGLRVGLVGVLASLALGVGVGACGSSKSDGSYASGDGADGSTSSGDSGGGDDTTSDAASGGDGATSTDGAVGDDGGAPVGDAGPMTHTTGNQLTVNGVTRTYDLTVPLSCTSATKVPLVFLLHGDDGRGADMYNGFALEAAASAAGDAAVYVYPDGLDNNLNGSAWDIYDDPGASPYTTPDPTGNKDVDFFDQLVAAMEALPCVDSARLFVTGFSNGAYMTNQLARWRPTVVKAAAPQSGGPPSGSMGPSTDYAPPNYCIGANGSVPVLIIHGQSDGTVDPTLGEQSAAFWDLANNCTNGASNCSASTNSLVAPPVTPTTATTPSPCVSSNGCTGAPVTFCFIPGMNHQIWSQAATTIWTFFATIN